MFFISLLFISSNLSQYPITSNIIFSKYHLHSFPAHTITPHSRDNQSRPFWAFDPDLGVNLDQINNSQTSLDTQGLYQCLYVGL